MVRLLAAALGIACLAGAVAAVTFAAAEKPVPPGVYAERAVLEFGELQQGDKVSGEFRLTNRFPAPITVLDVLTGCSCTEATPSAKDVPPGGSFTVALNWAIGARRDQLLDSVNVHYQTADGARHMAELGLSAHVTPEVHFSPTVLEFAADRPGTAVAKFTPGKRPAFAIKSASVDQRAFKTSIDAAKQEVTVTFDPAAGWTGIGADPFLHVQTDGEREPYISIPLRVDRPTPQAMSGER